MIQPLRTVHRRGFVGLAVVLPAILAVGLGSRRPRMPANDAVVMLPSSARLLGARHVCARVDVDSHGSAQ
jgi:hypothetical protein